MTTLVFVDTETTSLRPDRHAWEVGLIERHPDGSELEHSWFVDLDDIALGNADPASLHIGRIWDRHPAFGPAGLRPTFGDWPVVQREGVVLRHVERITRHATIIGANVGFDSETLAPRMRANGICPAWHFRPVDVTSMAAGALRKPPPFSFNDALEGFGITADPEQRHTALGDARLVRDLYDAILNDKAAQPA